ncbi:hypothetical protein [Rubrivirga sp.]|uniref:hypothetical protein n=1 Tax=Rubrivirga sp. TaxID=1885344 RepID=UPI003B52E262
MYVISIFAFATAAVLGLTMAVLHFRGQKSGKAMGLAHGFFALSGIVLLAVGLATVEAGPGWWILVSFLVVAAGGAYLFSRQLQDEPWPGWVIVAHGGLALATILVLGLWLADRPPPPSEDGSVPASTTENEPIPVAP